MKAKRETAGHALIVAFVTGAVLAVIGLAVSVPLDSLATPTPLCDAEIAVTAGLFLGLVAVMQPARDALDGSGSSICRLMRLKVEVPTWAKIVGLALFIVGTFFFLFWATADVLGGYNGYDYSFLRYPILAWIYNNTIGLAPFISSHDKGTQASLFMGLAILALVVLRLNRGVGGALKDAATLFVAPLLLVFEFGLWSQAPEDMTWHVTDYLSIGGIADGGYRARDFQRIPFVNYPAVAGGHFVGTYVSGPYLLSNWFVLCVALFLVASRLPGLSRPSTAFWRSRRASSQDADAIAAPAEDNGPVGVGGPAGRNSSADGAFEPTTLRFLWPEQADESAKADHYSRKLLAP